MISWDWLYSQLGQQFDQLCFVAPDTRLMPVSYPRLSYMHCHDQQSCNKAWQDTFKVAETTLTKEKGLDDTDEDTVYQHNGQYYMYRGTIPEFNVPSVDKLKLKSLVELEQFLEQELLCFSSFFKQLNKFEVQNLDEQLLKVSTHPEHQYRYLYKFKLKHNYYDTYLDLALNYTQLNENERERFANQWKERRHKTLSACVGYYEYTKTTYSFEGALYAMEQLLHQQKWSTDMLPLLIDNFNHKVQVAKDLVFDPEHSTYMDSVIDEFIRKQYFNNNLLIGKAQNVVLADISRCAWRKVRSYQGNGRFRGFIKTVIQNKIRDMWIEIKGKPRPPMWIVHKSKEDKIYITAYELLFRRNYLKPEAVSILMDLYSKKQEMFINNVVDEVYRRCSASRTHTYSETAMPDEDLFEDDEDVEPSQILEEYQTQEVLKCLNQLLHNGEKKIDATTLNQCFQHCNGLTDEECLILKLEFLNGLKLKEIAIALGISISTVHRRRAKAFEKLGDCLARFFGKDE